MRAAARAYALPSGTEVTLAFVDDAAMRVLNRAYRRVDKTTDVLSFGDALPNGVRGTDAAARLRAGPDGVIALGDIVISGTQAARQARRRRWALSAEVAFLAAHGLLHLLGFDDRTNAGYREMLALGRAAVTAATPAGRRGRPRTSTSRKTRKTLER
jgi:probable rRNA maturation factor